MTTIFSKIPRTLGVADFRAGLADNLAKAKKQPLVVLDRRAGDTYVVLSADAYNDLVDARELAIDARELTRLVKANAGKKFKPFPRSS